MSNEPNIHPTAEVLLDYFHGVLSGTEEEAVETHVWSCQACATLTNCVRTVVDTVEGWTAEAHGKLLIRSKLLHALTRAEDETADVEQRERLRRWRVMWSGTAEAAVRAMIRTSAAARALAEGVDSLARPGSNWRFSAQPSFGGTWGDTDHELSTVLTTAPITAEEPRALVEVHAGGTGEIVVRIDNLPPTAVAPLVVLVAVNEDRVTTVQVALIDRQPDSQTFAARFTKVPPGEYIVALEPLATTERVKS